MKRKYVKREKTPREPAEDRKPVGPPRVSWWLDAPAEGFTARARTETGLRPGRVFARQELQQ